MRERFPKLLFAAILLACSLIGLGNQVAYAYKCKPAGTPVEELKEAAAVFVGKVKKVNDDGPVRITEFEVERYWKGLGTRTITVRSGKHLYGYRFTRGEKYLVYAYGEDQLEIDRCGRTTTLEKATYDLKELGEGKVPK